jgi:superfamily II DNA or RNA helicase
MTPAAAMELRPYQIEARDRVIDLWDGGTLDVLAVMATGLGKTELFLSVLDFERAAGRLGRALILAHREELIRQPVERIMRHWPDLAMAGVGIVMADTNKADARIVVATWQTLARERRLNRALWAGPFTHLIYDEAHHSTAGSSFELIGRLREINPALRHLGVTATPLRTDGDGLAKIYKSLAYQADIRRGIEWGYLVPLRAQAVETRISLRGIKVTAGDFNQGQLAKVFETDNCLDLVVESHQRFANGRKAIAFTAGVEGAHRLARQFNAAGIAAAAVDGGMPKEERRRILADFEANRIAVLCNCQVLTEGFDSPAVNAIHMVAPTKSDLVYVQRAGRGLRPHPLKEDCLILDYCPIEKRNIVMAGDVLGIPREPSAGEGEGRPRPDAPDGWQLEFDSGLEGDPDELRIRDLTYLYQSPFSWTERRGWFSLNLGQQADESYQSLVIAPIRKGEMFELWRVTERRGEGSAARLMARSERLGEVAHAGLLYANAHGQPWAMGNDGRWRSEPPTDKQRAQLARMGVEVTAGMRRGEATGLISLHFGSLAVARAKGVRVGR